jgi:glycosyltransferase involved in cell wall biosynthesis
LKVSIIIPAYKAERHIEESIRSVFRQTYQEWEIIVCEDGVFDETAALLKRLTAPAGQNIRLYQNVSNLGVSAARNRAIKAATGNFVAFLDADDIWEPQHLECMIATIQSHRAAAVYSQFHYMDEDGNPSGPPAPVPISAPGDFAAKLFASNFIQTMSVMLFERSWFDRGVQFDEALNYAEDVDLCLQVLALGGTFTSTGQVTCRYRKHATSAMAQTVRMLERMGRFYQKHLGNALIPAALRNKKMFDNHYWLGRMTWRTNPSGARATFQECRRLKPWKPQPYFWGGLTVVLALRQKSNA